MIKETYPLRYPAWPRTLLRDREDRKQWKKTYNQAVDALEKELKMFGAVGVTISRQDPGIIGPKDPSIAVHFSRDIAEDFSWQEVLNIRNPTPTREEIDMAFRSLAAQHHPDRGGDAQIFLQLNRQKQNALAYLDKMAGRTPSYTLGADKFKDARWNILAIRNTIHSLRQMERDGTSGLVQQAMEGFRQQITDGTEHAHV